MRTTTVIGLGVLAIGAWLILSGRLTGVTAAPARSERDWKAIIGALPPDLSRLSPELRARTEQRYLEATGQAGPDLTLAQGALSGAQAGVVGGPWGIAIGAGGGAVASFFT